MLATPLSITAISQLLGMETNNIKKRLNQLHSVLNIPDNLDIPVRLLHLSFRDFLLDTETKDEEESEQFWIDEKAMHQTLTDYCIMAMKCSLKRNICNLQDDSVQQSDVTRCSINHYLPPELQYTCRYWTQHLVQCQNPIAMLIKAFSFLKVHFLHWVEAMSVLGMLSEVVGIIRSLQSVIQVSWEIQLYLLNTNKYRMINIPRYQNFLTMPGDLSLKIDKWLMLHHSSFIPRDLCLLQETQ
jgi:hypothetical protein